MLFICILKHDSLFQSKKVQNVSHKVCSIYTTGLVICLRGLPFGTFQPTSGTLKKKTCLNLINIIGLNTSFHVNSGLDVSIKMFNNKINTKYLNQLIKIDPVSCRLRILISIKKSVLFYGCKAICALILLIC